MNAEARFGELVGELDYPMLIVTVAAGGERGGCLVGFATQSSIDPARFLVCLSKNNRTYRLAREAASLAVHFVPEDAGDLVELFGGETGDELDKFERCDWRAGPEGLPILESCGNWFVGTVIDRIDVGDHVAFQLAPLAAERRHDVRPFPFHRAREIDPGHEA